MSKRLWNVFYRMLPVSLLETAQPCIENASMDIVIEERMRDGSARDIRRMRHVKVCHSQNESGYRYWKNHDFRYPGSTACHRTDG